MTNRPRPVVLAAAIALYRRRLHAEKAAGGSVPGLNEVSIHTANGQDMVLTA